MVVLQQITAFFTLSDRVQLFCFINVVILIPKSDSQWAWAVLISAKALNLLAPLRIWVSILVIPSRSPPLLVPVPVLVHPRNELKDVLGNVKLTPLLVC
jgi:hypothetical protein